MLAPVKSFDLLLGFNELNKNIGKTNNIIKAKDKTPPKLALETIPTFCPILVIFLAFITQ